MRALPGLGEAADHISEPHVTPLRHQPRNADIRLDSCVGGAVRKQNREQVVELDERDLRIQHALPEGSPAASWRR